MKHVRLLTLAAAVLSGCGDSRAPDSIPTKISEPPKGGRQATTPGAPAGPAKPSQGLADQP